MDQSVVLVHNWMSAMVTSESSFAMVTSESSFAMVTSKSSFAMVTSESWLPVSYPLPIN